MKKHELIIAPISDWDYIKRLGGQGILQRSDVKDLKSQRAKVLHLMLDGRWHKAGEILEVSGGREGLRRLRELRDIPHASIEKAKKIVGGRDFWYRLNYTPGIQKDLF